MPIPCDLLLTNAHILTMDEQFTVHAHGAIAVSGGEIVGVGQIAHDYAPGETIDCRERVVMPGLINAHTHAPMTLLRGLADDLRLDVWLLGYMMPVERAFVRPDFVALGTSLACAEMIRSGTTCFADMYYFEEAVAEATAKAGMRALCGQTVLKFPAPDAASFEDSLSRAREFITTWKGHRLITPSVAPHAPYTCTEEILRLCAELAHELDVPLHTHLAETSSEVDESRREHGMSVIPWVKKHRLFDAHVLAAHCVHVDGGEMTTLNEAHAGVAHNPTSNLKLGSGIAPVARMIEHGIAVGIGTDGAASNNDLDMFEELRLAALLAKGADNNPTALPARDALLMATRMGARAIGLEAVTGSLEPGKRADLIVVDLDQTHNAPRYGRDAGAVYSQLVYAAKATDVVDVMCDGHWLMRDRRLLTIDEAGVRSEAADVARRIDTFLIEREGSVLQKLVAIGGASEQESFEVQVKVKLGTPEDVVKALLASDEITVIRSVHYHQYDTYFFFDDPAQGRLRYREDETLDANDNVVSGRARLTLTGQSREATFGSVLLVRSRFLAPAAHSPRFYREYFRPAREREVVKDRRRWLVAFHGVQFYVHLDRLAKPHIGDFLELKSRTWSRRDAQDKAAVISELLRVLGTNPDEALEKDYVEL
jgi:5-methylthioadenosine/S-adenosylhomocysteine deaminase